MHRHRASNTLTDQRPCVVRSQSVTRGADRLKPMLVGVFISAFILLSAAGAAADLSLEVSADRNRIYLGEAVILTVSVNGDINPPEPDLSGIQGAAVRPLGSQAHSFTSASFANGRLQRTSVVGRKFTYAVAPAAAGRFTAGPVVLETDGRTLREEGPVVEVVGVAAQNDVLVSVRASRETVLVDEPFDIVLAVAVRQLPGEYAPREPLDGAAPPALNVPYLAQTPDGLDGPDLEAVLRRLHEPRGDRPGFSINDIPARQDPFDPDGFFGGGMDDFFRPRPARFRLEQRVVEKDSGSYVAYSLALRYVPRKEGDYTFGPVTFKGPIVAATDRGAQLVRQGFFAVGPACTVRVVPPPEEGRPPTFIGAVGAGMAAEAALDAQTCNVGDPLKLTLRVSGGVNTENVRPPVLAAQTNLTRLFRTYDGTVQTASRDGAKEFTYTVRPVTPGTIELPPVALSYYNSERRAYETVLTRPVPLRVNETAQVGYEMVIAAGTNGPGREAAAAPRVMAPLDVSPEGAVPVALGLRAWQRTVCLLSPIAYFLGLAWRALRAPLAAFRARRRRGGALGAALDALREAGAAGGDDPHAAARLVCRAVSGYLARRFDVRGEGMTPADAVELLRQRGAPAEIVAEFERLHRRGFEAAYAARAEASYAARDETALADRTLRRLDKALGVRRRRSARATAAPALLVLALLTRNASGLGETERRFRWNEANAALAAAATPEEALAAARKYRELAADGVRNGPLFYNCGTAMLRARRYDEAVALLLRAERYCGSNDEIKRNMLLAIAARDGSDDAALPWYRGLLFWHYDLGISTRIAIAVLAFAAVWPALLARAFGRARIAAPLLTTALAVLIVFGSSALATLHQERSERLNPVAVADEAEAAPKAGAGAGEEVASKP
ncbi:MAG: protein BatD [Lentisphaerae bacterium]|nr:protein BatD [Lentisphaerota bacterium]